MPMRGAKPLTCHVQAPGQVGKGEAIHNRHLHRYNAHIAVTMAPCVCCLQLWHRQSASDCLTVWVTPSPESTTNPVRRPAIMPRPAEWRIPLCVDALLDISTAAWIPGNAGNAIVCCSWHRATRLLSKECSGCQAVRNSAGHCS